MKWRKSNSNISLILLLIWLTLVFYTLNHRNLLISSTHTDCGVFFRLALIKSSTNKKAVRLVLNEYISNTCEFASRRAFSIITHRSKIAHFRLRANSTYIYLVRLREYGHWNCFWSWLKIALHDFCSQSHWFIENMYRQEVFEFKKQEFAQLKLL